MAFLLASALAHAAIASAVSVGTEPSARAARLSDRGTAEFVVAASDHAAQRAFARQRALLIAEASALRDAGRLRLGTFVLDALALEARSAGDAVDRDALGQAYDARVAALARAPEGETVAQSVERVFGDLAYVGRPGSTMADALREGGAACEGLSHLIAAALIDAGKGERVQLVVYGKPGRAGVSHLTAVTTIEGERVDLVTGDAPQPGGTAFSPFALVSGYERAIDAPPPAGATVFSAGYPEDDTEYLGDIPLYASRGVMAGAEAPTGILEQIHDHPENCGMLLPLSILSPPRATALVGDAGVGIELMREPSSSDLERTSALITSVERWHRVQTAPVGRLFTGGCLLALQRQAAIEFTLAGEPAVGRAAADRAKTTHAELVRTATKLDGDDDARQELFYHLPAIHKSQTWLLALSPETAKLGLALIDAQPGLAWHHKNLLAALVVAESSRTPALQRIEALSPMDQIEIMHLVFQAHERFRPWTTAFDFEPAPKRPGFLRGYEVFRALAWRHWGARQPIGVVLQTLDDAAREAALSPAWEAALLGYLANSALELSQYRTDGLDTVLALSAAVRARGNPPQLADLRGRLDVLLERGRLDPETLAEAWRRSPPNSGR